MFMNYYFWRQLIMKPFPEIHILDYWVI